MKSCKAVVVAVVMAAGLTTCGKDVLDVPWPDLDKERKNPQGR
jgi:hypothetical protein